MHEHTGLVMVQRNEGALLRANIRYHLARGVTHVVVVDNDSTDPQTHDVLRDLSKHVGVTVLADTSSIYDQTKLANWGLQELLTHREIDWIFPCDADEFIWCAGGLQEFLDRCRREDVLYGSIQWLNHIPEVELVASRRAQYLEETLFYLPFVERPWQSPNHFRKAFCYRHSGMEIVVGGHFFKREANSAFFSPHRMAPMNIPEASAILFHYELRDCATALVQKWRDLGERHFAGPALSAGPWREKEDRVRQLSKRYHNKPHAVFHDFARARRTLWGTEIPVNRTRRRSNVARVLDGLDP
jgi:hypothetical protein